ncbi:MAG TPA: hypothetical protein VMH91_03980 [Candidatus Paceibacterota bacterium]|nr:hypothetical protein [Candidatus Paceibacterota bacterium]
MAPRKKRTSNKKLTLSEVLSEIDNIVDDTIERHTEEARKKERDRVEPRRQLSKAFAAPILSALESRGNGLPVKKRKIAEVSEHCGKEAAKALALEPLGKKERQKED